MPELRLDPETHSYSLDGFPIPGVSHILKSMGYIDLSKVPPDILERKRQIGVETHKACELIDRGKTPTMDPLIVPYVKAYETYVSVEKPVYSEIEEGHYYAVDGPGAAVAYAGTVDRVEHRFVLDLKTAYKIYPAHRLQLAAYSFFYPSPVRIVVLQLKPDETYKLTIFTEAEQQEYRDEWMRVLLSYAWRKRYKIGV